MTGFDWYRWWLSHFKPVTKARFRHGNIIPLTPDVSRDPVAIEGKESMAISFTTKEETSLGIQAEDADGNPLPDPGTRVWASSDVNVLIVSDPDVNGVVTIRPVGVAGTATVTVTDTEPTNPDGSAGMVFVGSEDYIVSLPEAPITQIVMVPGPIIPFA